MSILVVYASKHGATRGIAEHIAQTLRALGREADVVPVDAVERLGTYDAVLLGSAVYYGSWMKEAVEFVRRNRVALAERPVWLFSSGPLGTEVQDSEEQPKELGELQAAIGARDHRLFYGALDPHALSFPERMVVKAVRAPQGDFRDWEAIAAWATDIARALAPSAGGESTSHPASAR
ncbi:MAG TPA: flavodoxin domain-containing protein [Ktedonobacterales bacterium]|nr:flavodoxin domain-containing protein [Ktedonobacterales bacterium]